ncbi:MAG: right-handed parallel beta-helix repeat-containing protein [Sedimentisphaerales bacterium]|nr:right-handed parallel beta-helix repeat-containing protein [Sedimentisphaerales bacterium]
MKRALSFVLIVILAVHVIGIARDDYQVAKITVGPRGPVGPDVPLGETEKRQYSECVVVKGHTAAAVQAACKRAVKEGIRVVFLPAGQYIFKKQVGVPGGIILLGEGSKTLCRAGDSSVHLFSVEGDMVRFTRLKLQGANTSTSTNNDTYGIVVSGRQDIRIDHCELLGFSYATSFASEATVQVDHCFIHHNLRDGLGYGVAIYSGAYVLVSDNEFSQNRHSLASNGALDWSSPKIAGKFLHKPGIRKTHWEFIRNKVGSNDHSRYELCVVDTHPGMDGTFVVEGNLFEKLRHGVGIRDGSGLIRGNVFRNLRTATNFRDLIGISVSYGKHNGIPVEGCMPRDITIEDNIFLPGNAKYKKYQVSKAENITIDGELVSRTRVERAAVEPMPLLIPVDDEGKLGISRRKTVAKPR